MLGNKLKVKLNHDEPLALDYKLCIIKKLGWHGGRGVMKRWTADISGWFWELLFEFRNLLTNTINVNIFVSMIPKL